MTFWPLTNYSDFRTDQTFHQFHDLNTELDLNRNMSSFFGTFATGVECLQGTLTLQDTWFRPPFWDLLMLQLLWPDFPNFSCLYSIFHLEYPSVLSQFCFQSNLIRLLLVYCYIIIITLYFAQESTTKRKSKGLVGHTVKPTQTKDSVARNHHIKRVVPCRCRTGTLKNPTKCLWRLKPTVGTTSSRIVQSLGEFRRFLDKDKIIVPNYYYFGQRKSQVIHTRLRLNCSSLGSDLLNNHISENANCLFCNVPETVEHYLLHCNNDNIRLQTIYSLGIAVNVNILLKGCPLYDDITNRNIFSVVQEFIRLSKRFK